MSFQRHDTRTQAPQKYGKPGVSYPYGSLDFPRIVEMRTAKKGDSSSLIPFLTPHRDQKSFPGAVLVDQQSDVGDDTDKNLTETYEVLPGPIFVEVSEFQDTGIPILVAKQKVAAPDDYTEGEIVPAALNVVGISTGNPCTVTLDGEHELPPRAWVKFVGTGSTPVLDGNQRIVAMPAANQVQIAVDVTVAGGRAGTMQAVNRIVREMKPTGNVNMLMKVDSMVAVPDLSGFNEDIAAWKDYSFPDFLIALNAYRDDGTSTTSGATEYGLSFTGSGSCGLQIQNGYRGPCQGRRQRLFSMGPVSDAVFATYTPTFIMPSSGTYAVKSESMSIQASTGGSSSANSHSFKVGTIPPVLTAGKTAPDSMGGGGGGGGIGIASAEFYVDLPPSQPIGFTRGDTITLVEQPQKLGVGLWQLIVWQLVVPYTSGLAANVFVFTFNGANAAGVSIPVTGLMAHDVVINCRCTTVVGDFRSYFVSPIASDGSIVQAESADLSSKIFTIEITR